MKPEYTPDELLPLSGIQHFLFCRKACPVLTARDLPGHTAQMNWD
jgi:hypothetical protein